MKTFSTIFMVLAIVAGLILALTPFVADKFFPIPENSVRQAKPEAAAMALKQWFKSPDAKFEAVQALNKITPESKASWFSFSVGRAPVERYIIDNKLKQTTLNHKILQSVFFEDNRPASWWQPTALAQETYFTGTDQGYKVSLIYNPKAKRGVLVAVSQ